MSARRKTALRRPLLLASIAVVCAASLAACGRRGDLEAPPGADPDYPRTYPAPGKAPGASLAPSARIADK
jgi:predicted small lipoprotein YifL